MPIMRQPGANVIATVDRIKTLLPQLEASIPPTIKVSILSDRTQTIRASVSDVQFTLLLSVGLVVLLIATYAPDWIDTGLCVTGGFDPGEIL